MRDKGQYQAHLEAGWPSVSGSQGVWMEEFASKARPDTPHFAAVIQYCDAFALGAGNASPAFGMYPA